MPRSGHRYGGHGTRRTPPPFVVRRRPGPGHLYDVIPTTWKEFHSAVKRRKHRRLRRANKCRKEIFVGLKTRVGEYTDPPRKAAYSRMRERVDPRVGGIIGVTQNIDNFGHVVNFVEFPHLFFPKTLRTWDEIHPWIQSFDLYDNGYGVPTCRENRIRFREGGPFHCYRAEIPIPEVQGIGSYTGMDLRPYGYGNVYNGGFVSANWSHGYSATDFMMAGNDGSIGPDFESAAPYGASAYNKFKPRTQAFDAMQFLFDDIKDLPQQLRTTAELMKGSYRSLLSSAPRSVRQQAARELVQPRSISEQFLNYQFGWAPFIGDLAKLYDAYESFNKRYAQVKRDNGHWIKRGGSVVKTREESDKEVIEGGVYPVLTSDFYSTPGHPDTTTRWTSVERDVWFSGQFKYYIPGYKRDLSDVDRYELFGAMLRHYGVGISPSVVWELTPWTWLVDWFSNAGDVISNISSVMTDQLVSRNAFVMCHAKHLAYVSSNIHLKDGEVHCFWYQEVDTKKRTLANPYGFGLTWGDLTPRQLGILAALGITRADTKGLSGGPR
jgi:hypothetical protein